MKLIYEKSQAGRRGLAVPKPDLPVPALPPELARKEPPKLPELAEPEVLRHFTELSRRNFGIDNGFYPLGSCTMKYNPRVNERLVGIPGFRDLHPLAEEEQIQGALILAVVILNARRLHADHGGYRIQALGLANHDAGLGQSTGLS